MNICALRNEKALKPCKHYKYARLRALLSYLLGESYGRKNANETSVVDQGFYSRLSSKLNDFHQHELSAADAARICHGDTK